MVDQVNGHGVRGLGKGLNDGLLRTALKAQRLVARCFLVDAGRLGIARLADLHHAGQRLVVHLHQLGRVQRLVQAVGHDHGHDFAHMAHPVLRHGPAWRLNQAGVVCARDQPQGGHLAYAGCFHVHAREHGHAARALKGCTCVYAFDDGMGVGRAHKGAMPHALDHDVSHKLPFAYQQSMVFAAQDRLANTFRMHVQFRLCVLVEV